MSELKDLILELLKKEKRYYTRKDLRKIAGVKGEKLSTLLDDVLDELESDGYIFLDERKGYTLFKNNRNELAFGTIEINKKGNGFVHTSDGYTIFIPCEKLDGAMDGDKVITCNMMPMKHGKTDKIFRGEIYRITKRTNAKILLKVNGNGKDAILTPYNSKFNIPVSLEKNIMRDLIDGQIIEAELPTGAQYGTFEGSFVKVVGHVSDPDIDIKALAEELGVETNFSDEEMEEVKNMPKEVTEDDRKGRVDLRDKKFFTIDCDNTKDRDDAVCIEKLSNGNYKLYVSIASVNHYVKRGMALYEGMKRRCTSHYPNNTCMPLLPHELSNGICSLNEKVDRLVKTCEMEIDHSGNVVNSKIYNAVINSKKVMTYTHVNEVLEGNTVDGYDEFKDDLFEMQNLSEILSKAAENRKYLNFDIPEIEVKKDENNKNVFYQNPTGKAQKLIENFMVVTDNTVATNFCWLPIIYRIHENPNDELLQTVLTKIKAAGGHISIPPSVDINFIKKLLNIINESEELKEYNTVLLRAMAKAKYSVDNEGHFALQLDNYCHFTSPIRRIADFMVHTIIDEAESHGYDPEFISILEKEAYDVAGEASKAEKLDKTFESEARKMAMAETMEEHIGETFTGKVVSVYEHGLFVRLDSLIYGKVSLEDISPKARYNPDIDAVTIGGTHDIYRIGDIVNVKVLNASKIDRTIEFAMIRERCKKKTA